MKELIVDNDLKSVIPPLTDDEFKRLETSCIKEGIRDPIVTWNGIIVDGHNRYEIAKKHNLDFDERKNEFTDRWDAIAWMCANQMSRRNLNDIQMTMLIGKEYEARKRSAGEHKGNQYTKMEGAENERFPKIKNPTAVKIGKEHGVSQSTVRADAQFVKGVEAAEDVSPGFTEAIVSGKVKAPKEAIGSLHKIKDKQELKEAVEAIKNPKPKKDAPKVSSKAVDVAIASLKPENVDAETEADKTESIRNEMSAMFTDLVKRIRTFTEIHPDFDAGELRAEANKMYDNIDVVIGELEKRQGF